MGEVTVEEETGGGKLQDGELWVEETVEEESVRGETV